MRRHNNYGDVQNLIKQLRERGMSDRVIENVLNHLHLKRTRREHHG